MSSQSGTPEAPLVQPGAPGRASSRALVAQDGLVPRPRPTSGPMHALGPVVRIAHDVISRYFTAVLVGAIVVAILATYKQGGFTLAGEQLKNALVLGAIYALVAIGYTMVYGIIELINFAHGDVFTAAGFFAVFISGLAPSRFTRREQLRRPPARTRDRLSALDDRGRHRRGRHRARRLSQAARLAAPRTTDHGDRSVSFLIEGILLLVEGPDNVPTDQASWINGTAFTIGQVNVLWTDLFVVGMALLLMFALGEFVRRTRLGKAMRSTAQDRTAALLCGININRTISATFFIGSALAAAVP